jgi:hypothetical protein
MAILHLDIRCNITTSQVLDYKGNGGEGGIRSQFYPGLWMVGVDFQIGEQKRFAAGLMTAAIGLYRYKYGVDLCQCFRVITLQNPALFRGVVLVENTQVDSLLPVWTSPAPRLESAGTFQFGLLIQIVRIENQ